MTSSSYCGDNNRGVRVCRREIHSRIKYLMKNTRPTFSLVNIFTKKSNEVIGKDKNKTKKTACPSVQRQSPGCGINSCHQSHRNIKQENETRKIKSKKFSQLSDIQHCFLLQRKKYNSFQDFGKSYSLKNYLL